VDPGVLGATLVRVVLRRRPEEISKEPPASIPGGNPHVVSVDTYRKKFPRKVIKEFEAGVKDADKGKIDKAIKHYQEAVKLAPDFYPAHNNLGTLYLSQRNIDAAEAAFSEVIKLNSTDANAYFNLGNVFFLTQRYEDAERVLHEGLSRQSLSAFGHYLLGSVRVRRGRYPEAEPSLQRAIRLDPEMPNVRLELVNLYLVQQRKDDAIRELQAFVELFPDDPMLEKVEELLARLQEATEP
jgi:tetratricopeptide (TPR) repeat protein